MQPTPSNEAERISKIPENITTIKSNNVEFEKNVSSPTVKNNLKHHRRIFKIIVIGDSNVGRCF